MKRCGDPSGLECGFYGALTKLAAESRINASPDHVDFVVLRIIGLPIGGLFEMNPLDTKIGEKDKGRHAQIKIDDLTSASTKLILRILSV